MVAFAVSLSSLLAQAASAAPGASPAGSQSGGLLAQLPFFLLIGIMFYFVLLRPQQKRAKEQAALIASVKSGDEIVTNGGLHGIVSNARDADSKTVLVKFAENVKIEVDKSAITTVIKADAKAPLTEKAAAPTVKVS